MFESNGKYQKVTKELF